MLVVVNSWHISPNKVSMQPVCNINTEFCLDISVNNSLGCQSMGRRNMFKVTYITAIMSTLCEIQYKAFVKTVLNLGFQNNKKYFGRQTEYCLITFFLYLFHYLVQRQVLKEGCELTGQLYRQLVSRTAFHFLIQLDIYRNGFICVYSDYSCEVPLPFRN